MLGFYLVIKAIVLGFVEGLTEFLPVSSTGHLIIFGHFLDFKGAFATSFEVMIQLGAVLAIVVLYRTKIFGAFKNLGKGKWGRSLAINVIVGVIPALILAVLFKDVIKSFFGSVVIVAVSLIIGAILLYVAEKYTKGKHVEHKKDNIDDLTAKDSLVVGLFQCLALVPGMSRSGSTISGGLFRGLSPRLAAEFSFFLAIPIMFGAFVFELKDLVIGSSIEVVALVVGFVVSFIVAYFVVKVFVDFLGKHSYVGFVIYRAIVGVLLLVLILSGIING
ncbi:MAG: undecaprenyl-diphosphate phosphatase [Firmicutes bacterium]|nr:undecaprenyl-diphosphate phosphatase [Bacillota bacterium]